MLQEQLFDILRKYGSVNVPQFVVYSECWELGHHPSDLYELIKQLVLEGKIHMSHKRNRGKTATQLSII